MLFYFLIFLCSILLFMLNSKHSDYWKKRNVTQIDGTIWKFLFGDRSLSEYYKETYDRSNAPQIGLFLGSKPALMLKNLQDIQAVLASDFHSFHSRGIVMNSNDVLGDNILFIDDFKRWKIIRHKFSPVFTSSRLKTMFCVMERRAHDYVKHMENNKRKDKPFNAVFEFTAASIGAAILGVETQNKNTLESPLLEMVRKTAESSFKRNLKFFIGNSFPRLFRWLGLKFFGEHEDFFVGAVKSILERRRNGEKQLDFIDVCLEIQKNGVIKDVITGIELEPTDELIAAQAFFFFIAGVDTTANAMHFALLELSSNPDILMKVHDEIDEIFKDGKEELAYEDLDKLQYLNTVVSEAMRKYPPIGVTQRVCTKDTILPSNGLKIEKGVIVIIPIFGIHRDETYYPSPELYDPERFAANNVKEIQKYSYLAFGEGKRICIGARFARLQIKIALMWLLRRFTLVEQKYKPLGFGRSTFNLRDVHAQYELIPREI